MQYSLIKKLVTLQLLILLMVPIPLLSTPSPENNNAIVAEAILKATEEKARYEAKREALESENFWLRVSSIALTFFVCYQASK